MTRRKKSTYMLGLDCFRKVMRRLTSGITSCIPRPHTGHEPREQTDLDILGVVFSIGFSLSF